ncbi:flagellar basal body rod protein FlgB [Clostridium tyrobutyricum]|uniref:flagellar basal body rod protein FlgB n=1 Tax=Clostridium tyrobutyricum TaxID=1519 RepID=UPI001C37F3D5|nr:flagellar basal body rod protein FlgB [Clostridium tyrobutyricum]MBV4419146.1 flagellar basal body rod protein FlgB [Clostridium tyrobutyricum]
MNISNISNDQLTDNLLSGGLDAASARSSAISNNIANINTKGYKRQYVTFEENLKQSMDNIQLKQDDTRHIGLGNDPGSITTNTDNSTSMRDDGNNVDINVETVNQAANELMYNSLITLENNRLSMRKSVIMGN